MQRSILLAVLAGLIWTSSAEAQENWSCFQGSILGCTSWDLVSDYRFGETDIGIALLTSHTNPQVTGDLNTVIERATSIWNEATTMIQLTNTSTVYIGFDVVQDQSLWPIDAGAPAASAITYGPDNEIESALIILNFAHYGPEDYSFDDSCQPEQISMRWVISRWIGYALGLQPVSSACATLGQSVMGDQSAGECYVMDPTWIDANAIKCLYGDFIADATVEGLEVIDGEIRWKTVSHRNSDGFILEESDGPDGPWTELVRVEPRAGSQSVSGLAPGPYVRIVELDRTWGPKPSGVTRNVAQRPVPDPQPTQGSPSAEELRMRMENRKRTVDPQRKTTGGLGVTQTESPTCVVFCASAMVPDVQSYVADYWESKGETVWIEDMGGYSGSPEQIRDLVRWTIQQYRTVHGTSRFHLIGDANDHYQWDPASPVWQDYWTNWEMTHSSYLQQGYALAGQPSLDVIPTFVVRDPNADNPDANITRLTPYWTTDQPYADTDQDGVPDVVVTRWPVSSVSELLSMANKMQAYNDNAGASGPYSTAMLIGDPSGDPGDITRALADDIQAHLSTLNPGPTFTLYESDHPTFQARNLETANLLNQEEPELVVVFSALSSRYSPGHFFVKTVQPFWDPYQLDAGSHTPLVLASSCHTGAHAWTEDPDSGTPPAEDMLVAADRGAIAWAGPTTGSSQDANWPFTKFVLEELYADPSRPMAESWLVAVQRACNEFAEYPAMLYTTQTQVFLGDPLSPFLRKPDDPISFAIDGPNQLPRNQAGTFTVSNLTGGVPPYSYSWLQRIQCSGDPQLLGTDPSAQASGNQSFCLKAIVSDSEGQEVVVQHDVTVTGGGKDPNPNESVSRFELAQNLPNPFRSVTRIRFDVPEPSRVSLLVFDVQGRVVKDLLSTHVAAGSHDVLFDASNLAEGIYFYRLVAGDRTQVRKMVVRGP